MIQTILRCCLEALRKDVDPQTVTFFFLQVGHPSKLGKPKNDLERNEIKIYENACKKASKFLGKLDDGLKGKFLDLLREEVDEEPKLQDFITEIENIPKKDLGRFKIVDTLPLDEDGSDITKDGVLKAMKGARDKELDQQKKGMRG